MISGNTQLLAVLGRPITHSLSPNIHNAMIQKLGLDIVYIPLSFDMSSLEASFSILKKSNIKGFNVTIPFKESIIDFLDSVDKSASLIGAVNTVVSDEGKWIGYNTDLAGFLYSLESFSNYSLKNKRVVCVGAGGSAKAVCSALLDRDIESLAVVNRSEESLSHFVKLLMSSNKQVDIQSFLMKDSRIYDCLVSADLVINTTPVGMSSLSDMTLFSHYDWVSSNHFCYDLIYSPSKTNFLFEAESRGAQVQNGLAMLVAQAAFSFKHFTGYDADFDFMYNTVALS